MASIAGDVYDLTALSYAEALKETRDESMETTIRKRRLFFAGAVARQSEGRLPSRVMFATITNWWGGPETGRSADELA